MPDLNRNELEALRILWEKGPTKPADVQAEFAWPIENATLRSVLRALVEKGYASRRKDGKAFYYRATASRRNLFSSMTRRMAQVFTGGSTAGLIAQLIKSERLSADEVEELRRIASDRSGGGAGARGADR
jgi:predicted transcriptional regulator